MQRGKISMEEVIRFLNKRRLQLEQSVALLEQRMSLLRKSPKKEKGDGDSGDSSMQPARAIPEVKPQPDKTEKQVQKTVPLKAEDSFDPAAGLDQKISFVLVRIGNGFKEDIVAELLELEPDLDPKRTERSVTIRLNYLLRKDLIQARLIGKNLEYALIDE